MKLLRFRIQNYRNIDDSGWISVDRVTAFVGRNEAGKTSLLKALHKFNPASELSYDPQREFPRDRYTRDYRNADFGGTLPVCSAEFVISGNAQQLISALLPAAGRKPPTHVTVTRHYDGSMTCDYDPSLEEETVTPSEVLDGLKKFEAFLRRLLEPDTGAGEQQHSPEDISDMLDWLNTWRDRLETVHNLRGTDGVETLNELRSEVDEYSHYGHATQMEAFISILELVLENAKKPSIASEMDNIVQKNLPIFIYFENYGILDSGISMFRFSAGSQNDPENPRIRTINAMFKHVGLDPEEIRRLGETEAMRRRIRGEGVTPEQLDEEGRSVDDRQMRLNSASIDISKNFSSWWSQRRHRIHYRMDGDRFRIWVSDDRQPDVEIELEARSKGFQWFFSFYLVFLVESEEMHKDAVLLLDEPGLHLHPTAQKELVQFFEKVSEKNQVLYTTHSPFLIDGDRLHRVRPVSEDKSGRSKITEDYWPADADTIFPLEAATGYAMMRWLFQKTKNVLVEGLTDFFYLRALSSHCSEKNRTYLAGDIHITPCGGTKNVGYLAALCVGYDVRLLIILDGDDAGRARKSSLLKNLFSDRAHRVMVLDEILGRPSKDVVIEDLVGESEIMFALTEVLGEELLLDEVGTNGKNVVERINSAATRQAVTMPSDWKVRVARHLVMSWAKGRPVPSGVLDEATNLFVEINSRFNNQ